MSTSTIAEPTMRHEEMISAEDFLERELGPSNGRGSTVFEPKHVAAPPPHITVDAVEPPRDPRSKVLPRLLAMADLYLNSGNLRQALEMYFDLYRNHEDSPEAIKAEDRILEVAKIHEQNGELHIARAIYEQLI